MVICMETKKRFTMIDFLIVTVVIAVIAAGVFFFMPGRAMSGEKAKASFTVLVSNKENGFSKAIHEGDRVVISLTEKDAAVITEVYAEPAEIMTFDGNNGKYFNKTLEEKEDIYITMEGNASVDETSVKIGSTQIRVGMEMHIKGKGYTAVGYVVDMEDTENDH